MPNPLSADLTLVAAGAVAPQREARDDRCVAAVGPGWFDSSWDLQRGLEVREGWSDDDRVRGWIENFLSAQRAAVRTASPSSTTAIA